MDRPILDRLASVPDRLAEAARAAPERPAGEWSAGDVVRHLIAVEEEVWHVRVRQLTDEEHPQWRWAEPDRWLDEPDASLDRLVDVYREARTTTVEQLTRLDDAGWARTGTHDTFGVLDVTGLLTKAVDHDEEHLASLVR
jgi:hypothetical protein